jgi:hypothetical protein
MKKPTNPGTADRLAGGWPPARRIVMTPYLLLNYFLFSVPLIIEFRHGGGGFHD